jgi:hypothetical protein
VARGSRLNTVARPELKWSLSAAMPLAVDKVPLSLMPSTDATEFICPAALSTNKQITARGHNGKT